MTDYTIFEYPIKKYYSISKDAIKKIIPSINNRDYRLFTNDIRSDISHVVIMNNAMLIKFGEISAIIFNSKCLFFCFLNDKSKEFITYIKNINNDNLQNNTLIIFENILIYLSNKIDNFLEESFNNFSGLSIENFKTNQLKDLLKFQHKVLIEQCNYEEYLESITHICKNINSFKSSVLNIDDEPEQLLNTYSNEINEDIKNLKRLIKKIEIFVELININLAEKRNRFAKNTLNLEIVSFTYSLSLFFTYILGTNLKNNIENCSYCILILILGTMVINFPIFFLIRKIFS